MTSSKAPGSVEDLYGQRRAFVWWPSTRSPANSQALRPLLPLAYPNKWRQGQATAVLAHVLIMALNALRT
jgi:hypothetical protein